MNEILKTFPPSWQNSSRSIAKSLMERFIKKPTYGLATRLGKIGIGVQWATNTTSDDYEKPEEFFLADNTPTPTLTDEELGELLKNNII